MFKFSEIIEITAGKPFNFNRDFLVKAISTDTRSIRKGELFIALNGANFKGADFISDAKNKGACGAIVSEDFKTIEDIPLIKIDDTLMALGNIATAHRKRFDIPVIAVTGSNGKTTTKDMIAHIMNRKFNVLKTEKTENNKIGVPLTVLRLKDHNIAVFETGTSSPGEIEYNASIAKPNIAVITNIGPSHFEGLKDINNVLNEKMALVRSLAADNIWVRNNDDPLLRKKAYKNIKVLSYGIREDKVDFKARNIRQIDDGIEFDIEANGACIDKFFLPMLGVHNVYNALAAVACCQLFMDITSLKGSLSNFKGPSMRMEVMHIDRISIINDSYNSNPLSLEAAILTVKDYPADGRKIVVAGDMLELGEDAERLHYESGKFIAESGIDILATFGELSRYIANGAEANGMGKDSIFVFERKDALKLFLREIVKSNDVILIKGSRRMRMEEVASCFITCSTT